MPLPPLGKGTGGTYNRPMHITLVDESVPFDGYSPAARPLGGAEKAFASLPGALARRGHEVVVLNRCPWGMTIEGARWEPLDGGRKPFATDVLIAFRKPSLLQTIRQAGKRVLWHTGPGRHLARPAIRPLLDEHTPLVLLVSAAQMAGLEAKGLATALLPPAIRSDYLTMSPRPSPPPPIALVTTHPAHGLDWLLNLWVERIHPHAPSAELHILSASLAKIEDGAAPEPEMAVIAAKVQAAHAQGVMVRRPQGDLAMAETYRHARLHLYPGHEDDVTAFTLMESQASGLPAVVRPLGAAPERIADGLSGRVAPDDEAFANLALMALCDDQVQAAESAEAQALYRGRDWHAAAERLEAVLQ